MGILSFAENVQVFDDVQRMLTVTENKPQICSTRSNPVKMHSGPMNSSLLRVVLGLFVALATVSMTLTLCL